MKHLLLIGSASVLLCASAAHATLRSDELLWKCQGTAGSVEEAVLGKMFCAGYVSGFLDSYRTTTLAYQASNAFCLPSSGISNDQAIRVVVKFLESRPEDLHETARTSVFLAFRSAFPCKSGG